MSEPRDLSESVAVVTGGAGGIGKGIVRALLSDGAHVVVADVEQSALDTAVDEQVAYSAVLDNGSSVSGAIVDMSNEASVESLAEQVFADHGRCNLLFNNAGVTSGGGGKPWEQESNDWRWCFGVNVFGVAHGVAAFVPRMIASGEWGQIINTSSGDGGFAPVPTASVYASSKAAVSCFTEALDHQLEAAAPNIRASVFYPSGGLMNTGLFTAQRNRPEELARQRGGTGRASMTFDQLRDLVGRDKPVADLDDLGRFCVDGARSGQFIIAHGLDETADLLRRRADAIGRGERPPHHQLG